MTWILIMTFIAMIIFFGYNAFVLRMFGIPNSLSATYYMCQEKNKNLKFLFPFSLFLTIATLMPAWLELSNGSMWQFTAFLSAASLMFTAMSPAFRKDILTSNVHNISAIIGVTFAILWIYFVAQMLWVIILYFIIK